MVLCMGYNGHTKTMPDSVLEKYENLPIMNSIILKGTKYIIIDRIICNFDQMPFNPLDKIKVNGHKYGFRCQNLREKYNLTDLNTELEISGCAFLNDYLEIVDIFRIQFDENYEKYLKI